MNYTYHPYAKLYLGLYLLFFGLGPAMLGYVPASMIAWGIGGFCFYMEGSEQWS